MDNCVLKISKLSKDFDGEIILKDLSFDVIEKDVIAIIGPSGSGKSTLLRCINLLELPSFGTILYKGKDIMNSDLNINDLRRRMGMVFQQFNLFKNKSVLGNLILPQMKVLHRTYQESYNVATKMLEKVHLMDYMNYYPNEISGGMQQRVAIARALCMDPEVMLFDEPTSALDPEMIGEVLEVIKQLADEGMTIIIVTHEMSFAKSISNKTLFIDDGRLIEFDKTEKVFSSTNPRIDAFMKAQNRSF